MEDLNHSIADVNLANKSERLQICKIYDEKKNEVYDSSFIEIFQKERMYIFPVHDAFMFAQLSWEDHQKTFWSITEVESQDDIDDIKRLQDDPMRPFAKIVALFFVFLKVGDDVILDVLNEDVFHSIKQANVCAFYSMQKTIEFTHQQVYSKIACMFEDSKHLVYGAFEKLYMKKFIEFGMKYKNLDVRCAIFLTVLTEYLMFVPAFQCINYLKKLGYCKHICLINDFVMRDEHLHYEFARKMLNACEMKLDINIANEMLNDMCSITEDLIKMIIPEDFDSSDGLYNLDVSIKHFRYVVAKFKRDNFLYVDPEEESIEQKLYPTSPAASYVCDTELNFKNNLMEVTNMNYRQVGVPKKIDFSNFRI